MAIYKNIIWREDMKLTVQGEVFANVHLMVGYNQASITDLQGMAEELRKTFPQAKDNEICCSKVTKSSYCQGFTLITWNAHIPRKDYPGWRVIDSTLVEYYWA